MGGLCVCLSVCQSVCLPVCLSVCLSACLSLSVSVCLCLSLSVSVCLCLSLSVSVFSSSTIFTTSSSIFASFTLYLLRISVPTVLDLTGSLALFTISLTIFLSPSPAIETDLPALPALAVLPTLWM